jgi:Ran-binding protein 1
MSNEKTKETSGFKFGSMPKITFGSTTGPTPMFGSGVTLPVFGSGMSTFPTSGFKVPTTSIAPVKTADDKDALKEAETDTVDVNKLKLPEFSAFDKPLDVKKGDEDEIEVYRVKSKLFRFFQEDIYGDEVRKNLWKERGFGFIRILKHKETGIFRVLMRQEKTKKICLNHAIDPLLSFAPNGARAWVFKADDYDIDGNHEFITYACRFPDEETAKMYRGAHAYARSKNALLKSADAGLVAEELTLIEAFKAEYLDEDENPKKEEIAETEEEKEASDSVAPVKVEDVVVKNKPDSELTENSA